MIPNQVKKNLFFLRLLFFLSVFVFFVGVYFLNYILIVEKNLEGKIYPNVYIDNVNTGGKTKKEIISVFSKKNKDLGKSRITVVYKEIPIATLSAQKLNLKSDIEDMTERAYLIGRVSHLPSKIYQKLGTVLNLARYDFQTKISYDKNVASDFITNVEQRYNKSAKNALFKFENNRVVSFRQEEKGVSLQSEKFLKDIDDVVLGFKNSHGEKTIILSDKIIEPEITLAKANQFGIEEEIGEGKSNFAGSIPERIHNIILASSKFNGVLIPAGEEFSFNQTVGDISSITGYKPAYIIKGGKTVLGDGGGVCQVSTTLFRAVLNTGLPIVERVAHAYRVGYYENDSKPGFDATVYAPSVDLKFKNDTPASILIQTEVDPATSSLTFRLYGKKDGRGVEISPVLVYDVQPPLPEIRQDDPTLKKGVVKQVDFPAWGAKATFTYKVTKGSDVVFEKKFFSSYRPWQAVYLVGTAD